MEFRRVVFRSVNHQAQPLADLPKPTVVATLETPNNALRLPAPQPKANAKVEDVNAPTVSIAARKLEHLPLNAAPVIPKPAGETNCFSPSRSSPSTTALDPSPRLTHC